MALDELSRILNADKKNRETPVTKDDDEAVEFWFFNGGDRSLADFLWLNEEQKQTVWEYMSNMPLYKEVESGGQQFILVHGGLENFSPSRPLADYKSCGAARKKVRSIIQTGMWCSDILPSKF